VPELQRPTSLSVQRPDQPGGSLSKGSGRPAKDWAQLDGTGKFHGELPKPSELGNYSVEELKQLRDVLEQSVQQRIRVNSALGPKGNHGLRQAQEQQLIQSINKYLENQ
jgi:hypothetical protein